MSKSIIIFGKGPSILRCTKEFVDKFDDIAICNYPVINEFFLNLIKDREILYHFANCATFDERYNDSLNDSINIKGIFNCHFKKNITPYYNFLDNKSLFKESIRENSENYIKEHNFDFDPSTGTLAYIYIY